MTEEQNTRERRGLKIGLRLKQLRGERTDREPLSVQQLADMTRQRDPDGKGIHAATLWRIEQGDRTARTKSVYLIAKALSDWLGRTVTMDELYQGGGSLSLNTYLTGEQNRRRMTDVEFAGLLGLSTARYRALMDGEREWQPNDMPGVIRGLPEASSLVVSTMAEYGLRSAKAA